MRHALVNVALALGPPPNDRLYVLGSDDSAATRLRVDVVDTATGAILATRQLAPREMAWENKALGEICEQLKDPERNGHRTLAELHEHMAEDDLVGWGWHPGAGRQPAPGTQQILGALVQAWIDTGAACP